MEYDTKAPIWLNKPPNYKNLRIQPGLRHPSRLYTPPVPFKRYSDPFPNAQLRIAKNYPEAHPQLLMFLNDSKNLFSRQLPNMGSGYITRLVFDLNAESVFILHDGIVTGAITSRLFPIEEFIEVAFLAVDSKYQAKGYGRLAMNYLKRAVQVYPYYDILACADNEAVIFFKKQGFNDKGIFMDPSRWMRRIKDYEGVTLVHCKLHPDVDYMKFSETIAKQIKFVEGMIGTHFIKPPPTIQNAFRAFEQGPTFASIPLPDVMRSTNTKYAPSALDEEKTRDYARRMEDLRQKLFVILTELENDPKFGSIFLRPVTEDIAPSYFDAIKFPMDFLTMRKRLKRFPDYYKRPEQFAADILLMSDNCKSFNQTGTIFIQAANSLWNKFRQMYNEAFPNNPL